MTFFLLVVHLQVVAGWSAVSAGAALIPTTFVLVVFTPPAAGLAVRVGTRAPLAVGLFLMAASISCSAIGAPTPPRPTPTPPTNQPVDPSLDLLESRPDMLVPGSASEPIAVFFRCQFVGANPQIGVIGNAGIGESLAVGQ